MNASADRVELLRDPVVAARWSGLAAALLVAAGWLVADSRGHPLSWALLVATLVASSYFFVQLVSPDTVRVTLGSAGIDAAAFGRRVSVAWDAVHVARVRQVAGEPVLALEIREQGPSGHPSPRRVVGVLLPLGSDVDALHAALERRLGGGGGRRTSAPTGGT